MASLQHGECCLFLVLRLRAARKNFTTPVKLAQLNENCFFTKKCASVCSSTLLVGTLARELVLQMAHLGKIAACDSVLQREHSTRSNCTNLPLMTVSEALYELITVYAEAVVHTPLRHSKYGDKMKRKEKKKTPAKFTVMAVPLLNSSLKVASMEGTRLPKGNGACDHSVLFNILSKYCGR